MNMMPRTRFDGRPLSEDELRAAAPSIFATTAHDSRSERFRPIPTIEIIRGLNREGFVAVGARQSTARDESRRNFTKHMIRLRRDGIPSVGGTVPEALLRNANDGSSAYDLMLGLFRVVCLNGLVADVESFEAVKVRHSGDVMGKVIEGTYRVLKDAEMALAAPADWSAIKLSRDEQLALAASARVARFGDAEGNVTTPISPDLLLVPRRVEDAKPDLWTTFNVVQENTIRGGLTARGVGSNGTRRRFTTRAVNGIDQDVKLNKALWVLAQRMAELKAA